MSDRSIRNGSGEKNSRLTQTIEIKLSVILSRFVPQFCSQKQKLPKYRNDVVFARNGLYKIEIEIDFSPVILDEISAIFGFHFSP